MQRFCTEIRPLAKLSLLALTLCVVSSGSNMCSNNNGDCSQLCLPTSPSTRSCMCTAGYSLRSGQQSCEGTNLAFRLSIMCDFLLRKWHGGTIDHSVCISFREQLETTYQTSVVDKVHRSSTWVKVQIRIVKYYSSKSKSTAFSILLEWKYKSTQFFMYLSKKVLIDRFI